MRDSEVCVGIFMVVLGPLRPFHVRLLSASSACSPGLLLCWLSKAPAGNRLTCCDGQMLLISVEKAIESYFLPSELWQRQTRNNIEFILEEVV